MIPLWRCSRQHQGCLPTGSRPVCERGWRFSKTALTEGWRHPGGTMLTRGRVRDDPASV